MHKLKSAMEGIRQTVVHFKELPNQDEVKCLLVELTGELLCFDEEFEGVLDVSHPTYPKVRATLSWVDKDISLLLDSLQNDGIGSEKYITTSFCTNKLRCISIVFEAGGIDYIEKSTLYLLKQLGGRIESDFLLPVWAGKKWVDIWPRSYWTQLKFRWHGWRYGTVPDSVLGH